LYVVRAGVLVSARDPLLRGERTYIRTMGDSI
jgi:hypothetical protein